MRFVIAIFGLLSSLSAQVICRPVDSSGNLDIASLDIEKIFSIENNRPVKNYLVTDYPARPARCFEHLQGTIGLNNGQVVHSVWVEMRPLERWVSDSSSCAASRSKEPLFMFRQEIVKKSGEEVERKQVSIPAEFCRAADQ